MEKKLRRDRYVWVPVLIGLTLALILIASVGVNKTDFGDYHDYLRVAR